MSRRHVIPAVLIAAVSLSFALMQSGTSARGQSDQVEKKPAPIGRYQVSAFSGSSTPGYYIIDTQTGELWHNYRGDKPRRVSGPLSELK